MKHYEPWNHAFRNAPQAVRTPADRADIEAGAVASTAPDLQRAPRVVDALTHWLRRPTGPTHYTRGEFYVETPHQGGGMPEGARARQYLPQYRRATLFLPTTNT